MTDVARVMRCDDRSASIAVRLRSILRMRFRSKPSRLSGDFELTRVKRLRIMPRSHTTIRCTYGCAWVTLDLEYEDRVLFQGDLLALPTGKGAFVVGQPECGLSFGLLERAELEAYVALRKGSCAV